MSSRQTSRTIFSRHARAIAASVLALVAPLAAGSCANEAPPRSFVQPNVLRKSDFQGTFYYLQTVNDAPPTNGSMFIGQSSSMLKIRFDIQENFLYARRAYPQVYNSESDTVLAGNDYMGEPLAAWRITSQFDIIRQYNSTTGEQTNEVVEDQERPWQQREFFRVDWSQNLITDYIGLGLDLFFSDGQPQVEPVSFWQSDPTKPDALHMEHLTADAGGLKTGDMTYLDVTDEMIVTPEQLNIEGFSFPKCFIYYSDDDCASQLIKIRHAFARIDPAHAYEAQPWDGTKMNLFGVWDVGLRHLTYNREYGITNTGFARYAARFNIWSQDSYKDHDHLLDDPTKLKTTKIPYYALGSMPVVYNGDARFPDGYEDSIYPPDLWNEFTNVVSQWNEAMKTAARDRTTPVGTDPATQPGWTTDIFVPCHSPVAADDDPVCSQGLVPDVDANGNTVLDKYGKPILHVRAGDPRHSYVYWVDQPQAAGPLGYGPPMYDEQTGETISGHAYIYGAALETYATRCRDLLLLLNGEVSNQDYVAGQPAINWVSQYQAGAGLNPAPSQQKLLAKQGRPFRNWKSYNRPLNVQDIAGMSKAMNFDWARQFTPKHGFPDIDTTSLPAMLSSIQNRQDAIYKGFFQNFQANRDDKLAQVVGTPLEKMLITPELMAVNGISPNLSWEQLSTPQQAQVSPLRWRAINKQLEQMRTGAELRGVDFDTGFDDVGMKERLAYYQKKFASTKLLPVQDQLRVDLNHSIFLAVTLHEVGHNMGCRHNFRGSWDALNYQPSTDDMSGHTPGYWELRTGALTHPDPGMDPADGQLHPRYVNKPGGAVTTYEMNHQIQEFQYTSIMDYGSEFYSDLHGLGLYDKALVKFSYAGYVEVFTDVATQNGQSNQSVQLKLASLQQQQSSYGVPSPLGATAGLSAIAYQSYPQLFNSGWQGIYKRADVPYAQIQAQPVGNTQSNLLADSFFRPLVPYYFCSDDFAGAGMTCQRFDSGADAYEQAVDIISRYQNFYLYNNFKRDRQTFHTTMGYLDRINSRYFDMLRQQLTWYVLWRSLLETFQVQSAQQQGQGTSDALSQENSFFVDENGWGNFTAAVALGYQLLGDVITTPNAGLHFQATGPDGAPLWQQINDELSLQGQAPGQSLPSNYQFIGLLDGKYPNTTWDFNGCGYYWADECQTRIGYLLDKEVALDVLSESQAYFIGRDTSTDVREYAIGYVIPFKAQLEEKIGAMLANDMSSLAPQFVSSADGTTMVPSQPDWLMDNPTIANPDPIDPQTGFTLQLWAGLFSLAAFPTTFDHSFINNTQVFVLGNGEAPVSDSWLMQPGNSTTDPSQLIANGGSIEWFTFTDPASGRTFAAHSVTTSPTTVVTPGSTDSSNNFSTTTVGLRADVGVRMLEKLATLNSQVQSMSSLPDTDSDKQAAIANYNNFEENIEIMRALQRYLGYGSFLPDPNQYF